MRQIVACPIREPSAVLPGAVRPRDGIAAWATRSMVHRR
jgi:hypothetical protein